eukprot:1194316-Prorocentrum_minimum.AAC.5
MGLLVGSSRLGRTLQVTTGGGWHDTREVYTLSPRLIGPLCRTRDTAARHLRLVPRTSPYLPRASRPRSSGLSIGSWGGVTCHIAFSWREGGGGSGPLNFSSTCTQLATKASAHHTWWCLLHSKVSTVCAPDVPVHTCIPKFVSQLVVSRVLSPPQTRVHTTPRCSLRRKASSTCASHIPCIAYVV